MYIYTNTNTSAQIYKHIYIYIHIHTNPVTPEESIPCRTLFSTTLLLSHTIQIHKYKYSSKTTNTQIQIHQNKYTNTHKSSPATRKSHSLSLKRHTIGMRIQIWTTLRMKIQKKTSLLKLLAANLTLQSFHRKQ